MTNNCMLTTIDNPFNPFEDYSSWLMFDKEYGYNSAERVDRIAKLSNDMTQKEVDEEIERAIDEIIKYDFLNIYTKVTNEVVATE